MPQDPATALQAGRHAPGAAGEFHLLTGAGPAAIAVIRLSGPGVPEFVRRRLRTRAALERVPVGAVLRATLLDDAGQPLDDILLSVHGAREFRLHLHGGPALVQDVCRLLRQSGFVESRAQPGQLFAAQNAIEAEAFHLLPQILTLRGAQWLTRNAARLAAQLRQLLESDGLPTGREVCQRLLRSCRILEWFARPARVVLLGPPNAGKSTLANALAQEPVSLVSPVAGTTRDWVEVPCVLRGFPVVWLDTAGVRQATGSIEQIAIQRIENLLRQADGAVVVLDVSEPAWQQVAPLVQTTSVLAVVLNKVDLVAGWQQVVPTLPEQWQTLCLGVSALHGTGLDELAGRVLASLGRDERLLDEPLAFTERQVELLEAAARAQELEEFRQWLRKCLSLDSLR